MTEKQKEQRIKAYERTDSICPACGGSIYQFGTPQYAHAIGNTESNRKKYGSFFIDSTYNGCLVCSLECNADVDVGKSPGRIMEKLVEILTNEIRDFYRG
jgi:hypothetical protein